MSGRLSARRAEGMVTGLSSVRLAQPFRALHAKFVTLGMGDLTPSLDPMH